MIELLTNKQGEDTMKIRLTLEEIDNIIGKKLRKEAKQAIREYKSKNMYGLNKKQLKEAKQAIREYKSKNMYGLNKKQLKELLFQLLTIITHLINGWNSNAKRKNHRNW